MGMKMTDEQQRGCYILYMSTEQEDQRCQLTFLTHPSVKEKQKKYKVNGKSWVVSKWFNVVVVAYKMSIHLAAVKVGATSETKDMFQS